MCSRHGNDQCLLWKQHLWGPSIQARADDVDYSPLATGWQRHPLA